MLYRDLEIDFATRFQGKWDDCDSGADQNGKFWRPVPDQAGFYPLGDLAVSGRREDVYVESIDGRFAVAVVKDTSGTALRPPTDYEPVWADHGSGAHWDGSMWRPIPPAGYVAMGLVCNSGYDKPSTDVVRCVRQDLAVVGYPGDPIWNDVNSGAHSDFSSWRVDPPTSNAGEVCFSPGTFIGVGGVHASRDKPARHDCAWVLRTLIPEQAPPAGATLRRPTLQSYDRPSPFEQDTVHYTTSLPWFTVKDSALSDIDKLRTSPVYRLEREDRYRLADHGYNDTTETQAHSYTYTEGVNKSVSESFSHTAGFEIGFEWEMVKGFKVSGKLSYSFTHTQETTEGWSKEESRTTSIMVPPGTAVALYTVESKYRLFRQDGVQVGNDVDYVVPTSLYWTQYPPRGAQATVITGPA